MILRCEAILFDLDGVLCDSAACVEATWRRWAMSHQLDPAVVIAEAHGRRTVDTIRGVAPQFAAADEIAALTASESMTTEGVYEVLARAPCFVNYRRRGGPSSPQGIRALATLRIIHTGLRTPDILICAEAIQRGKPDPEGYLMAARGLAVAPTKCIVVEDAPAGVQAATAAGMQSIAVTSTYACTTLCGATACIASLDMLDVICDPQRARSRFACLSLTNAEADGRLGIARPAAALTLDARS